MSSNIGFMQGRLSPLVNGKIQAFPCDHWRQEFPLAAKNSLKLMEWTLDYEGLHQNPLMTSEGRAEIRTLGSAYGLGIPSLTGDCFMQMPFYKAQGKQRADLISDLINVIKASGEIGIVYVVVPLVDNGRIASEEDARSLIEGLNEALPAIEAAGVKIVFESDFPPVELTRFMKSFDSEHFGINYDIGNSAALGYNPVEEISAYGARILNVHVKDRVLGGTTVPLGQGNADFPTVFRALADAGYNGNYICQTARAADGDHAEALRRYQAQIQAWLADARLPLNKSLPA
ncbi:MAG: sugar phosphate isomerase/epimerase [Sulfuricella sp.]|nr:sugar phosphate isomerase/epimerase [Sulfuricella sp.]